jgi:hypothetical protein
LLDCNWTNRASVTDSLNDFLQNLFIFNEIVFFN